MKMDHGERTSKAIAHLEHEMRHGRLSRRDFLRRTSGILLAAGLAANASWLSACAPTPTPEPPKTEPTQPPKPTPTVAEAPTGEVVWIGEETVVREDHFASFPESVKITRVLLTDQPAMIQKLRTGAQEADVVEANYAFMYWLREYDLIQPIDETKIKNWDKLLPGFKNLSDLRGSTGELQMIPTFWGTDAIAYNADEVSDEEASTWSVLWNDKFAGRTSIRNDAQESLAIAGIYLGHKDPWNQTPEELEKCLELLKENKSKFRTLWNTLADIESLFLNGEVVVAHSWFPIVKTLGDAGMNVKWAHPKEGAIGWIEGQTISKEAKHLDASLVLLDYLLSDDYVKSFYDATGYRGCTDTLLSYLPQEKVEELSLNQADDLLASLIVWGATLNMEEYQQTWTEFLSA